MFEPEDCTCFTHWMDWLNDNCINNSIILLSSRFSGSSSDMCAIITSHALSAFIRDASDDFLWWITACTTFWKKQTWIVPIFDDSHLHWMLAVISLSDSTVGFFDSYANRSAWHEYSPVYFTIYLSPCIII